MRNGINEKNNSFLKLQPDLVDLRQKLIILDAWPEAGDKLLTLLPHTDWRVSNVTKDDHNWIPLVIRDAVRGQDIGAQYPALFQKLLTNAGLRRRFLRALAAEVEGCTSR